MDRPPVWRAAVCIALGLLSMLLFFQAMLENSTLSAVFVSARTWHSLVTWLGAEPVPGDPTSVLVPLSSITGIVLPMTILSLAAGAWWLHRAGKVSVQEAAVRWADRGWRWWLVPGAWWLLSTAALLGGWQSLSVCLDGTSEFWLSMALAGWMNAWFTVRDELTEPGPGRRWGRKLAAAVLVSGVVFTALNWGLWFNLRVPHGDSAMYEEHLWNIEHGKGFRSYLDQGLFLGEHVQVVHLLLLPLHWMWPSQMLLELCQALAMAAGAIPVYRLALRFSRSPRSALWLACAYLLYFPVQYLDLTIDLKTVRPNSLGVPALLFALHELERGRKWACVAWLALMLSAQEDYAIVISLLGAWIALTAGSTDDAAASRWSLRAALQRIFAPALRSQLLFGCSLMVFGVVYLA
ncbi:MAG: DUF2079 domain-containing protein, partial [Planctomycetaceae bacterium]|nr:DUF2079 domain-containing protein [Planctomycetaceae bacterium]